MALGLRLVGFASFPFEQDELYTLRDALDLGASARAAGGPGILARPVYYLIQRAVLAIAPPTPVSLRIPALVFGLLGIWLCWYLGRRLFGDIAGFVAALLVAVSPWHLYESQFARYWTLVFALFALTLVLWDRAERLKRVRGWLFVSVVLVTGALTHPTFVFPLVGTIPVLTVVDSRGRRRPWRETQRILTFAWLPAALALGAAYLAIKMSGNGGALKNWNGRGLEATLRLVPAMVQWMGPVTAVAAAAAALVLGISRNGRDRRWSAALIAASISTLALLLAASLRTDVYADYGFSLLPLLLVCIGGMVQRIAEPARKPSVVTGSLCALLMAGVLPSTASHLSDGTRFDLRPALARIQREDSTAPVIGWPRVLFRRYAPQIDFRPLRPDTAYLDRQLSPEGSAWLVASYRRYGLVGDASGRIEKWLRSRCRLTASYGHPRIDYRSYEVELYKCRRPTSVSSTRDSASRPGSGPS